MKSCDICGLPEAPGDWFAYNEEHNLILCPVCEHYAAIEHDNNKVWQFGDKRKKQLAIKEYMSSVGKKGGSAPHKRPKDYFSKIAKLPRKRKSDNL
jgi:hypothetical protein